MLVWESIFRYNYQLINSYIFEITFILKIILSKVFQKFQVGDKLCQFVSTLSQSINTRKSLKKVRSCTEAVKGGVDRTMWEKYTFKVYHEDTIKIFLCCLSTSLWRNTIFVKALQKKTRCFIQARMDEILLVPKLSTLLDTLSFLIQHFIHGQSGC